MNKKTDFPDIQGEIHVIPPGVTPTWRPSAYIVVVENRSVFFARSRWSKLFDLLGGGLELGETFVEAALREFEEESGRRAKIKNETPFYIHEGNLFYRDENSPTGPVDHYWHVLACFYHGSLVPGEVDTELLARHETEETRWIRIEEIFDPAPGTVPAPIRPFYFEPLRVGIWRYLQNSGGWIDD